MLASQPKTRAALGPQAIGVAALAGIGLVFDVLRTALGVMIVAGLITDVR